MSTAITTAEGSMGLAPRSWEDAKAMASALARADGFVPDSYIGKPAAVLAAIMTGAELGIGPMRALRSIHVVKGRPVLAADLMLALAIERGIRHQWVETSETAARIRLQRAGFEPHEHSFTLEEAKRAGLAGRGNWSTYAPAMLRARCLSAALRAYCPDVLGGAYVEGEIDDTPPAPRAEPAPAGAAVDDVEPEDAEIVCGDAAPPAAPARLDQCGNEDELRAWIEQRGRALVPTYGDRLAAAVEAHAGKIGVNAAAAVADLHATEAAE